MVPGGKVGTGDAVGEPGRVGCVDGAGGFGVLAPIKLVHIAEVPSVHGPPDAPKFRIPGIEGSPTPTAGDPSLNPKFAHPAIPRWSITGSINIGSAKIFPVKLSQNSWLG